MGVSHATTDIAGTRSFAARQGTETLGDRFAGDGAARARILSAETQVAAGAGAGGNAPPVIDVPDFESRIGVWTRLTDIMSIADADGDAITHLALYDATGGDNWWADGGVVDAAVTYVTAYLPGIWFRGDPEASAQPLWVKAFDGTEWGEWESFTLTTLPDNVAPELSIADQEVADGTWTRLSDVLSIADADGDAITHYQLWDDTGGDNWWADGGIVSADTGYVTRSLSGIWFNGDAGTATQSLRVRAYDGTDWSAWESFALTVHDDNRPPDLIVSDTVLRVGDVIALGDVVSVSDAEGDPITRVALYDATGADNWLVDGSAISARQTYLTSSIGSVSLRADASQSVQTLWLRVHDGTDWSDWERFTLTTHAAGPNAAPAAAMPDVTVWGTGGAGYVTLNALIDLTDPDGDAITAIRLRDATGLHNIRVDGVGYVDARAGYTIWDPDTLVWIDGDLMVDPGAAPGMQTIDVQAFDGTDWGAWSSFIVTSLAGGA